jgi:putative transcriptional regulator
MTTMRSRTGLLLVALTVVGVLTGDASPPSTPTRPATGRLLVASRDLGDPNFARTVVLLLAYDDTGAMGVVVNRPTPRTLDELRPEVPTKRTDTIYLGGPVLVSSLLVLMRAQPAPRDAKRLFADVYLLTSRGAVDAALASKLPRHRLRFYAGHAGWAPGQLDAEVRRGDWHVMAPAADVVFSDAPGELWERLIARAEGEWTRHRTPPSALHARGSLATATALGRPTAPATTP